MGVNFFARTREFRKEREMVSLHRLFDQSHDLTSAGSGYTLCITMSVTKQEPRSATVRDLRNRFAEVAKWIEDGERVNITRRGSVFAVLAPAQPEKPRKMDWANRFRQRLPLGKNLSPEDTQALYDSMKSEL